MQTTVVIIGAGPAGLAMSACLRDLGVDHVLLEQGRVAQAWRTQRWDSLRLLTPNWLTRLPGYEYRDSDPDGYMTAAEVVAFLTGYRSAIEAPVHEHTTVTRVRAHTGGYLVETDRGDWWCRAVVIATGACGTPRVPPQAGHLPPSVTQLTSLQYRNPDQVEGDVLVVGASASGVQIADELARSGRGVTLAVGEHVRVPRRYRGRDIHWWLDAIGVLDERYDEVDDIDRVRRVPSFQLVGAPRPRSVDLNALSAQGVRLVGRLVGIAGGRAQLSGSLAHVCAAADLKQARLLDRIDAYVHERGWTRRVGPAVRPDPTVVATPPNMLDLIDGPIRTVVWATGFRPTYPWLDPALLDPRGALRHEGGIVNAPGMYVLGLPFTRRRKSSFLDGVGPDAREISAHLMAYLGSPSTCVSGRRWKQHSARSG